MILKDLCHIFRTFWVKCEDGQRVELAVASSSDIDRSSGVVDLKRDRCKRLAGRRCDPRYLIRTGDTIMFFNGARSVVGFPGYVASVDGPVAPSLSMCVLRPREGIDPVGMYLRLRCMEGAIRDLAGHKEGRVTYFLRMELLAELTVPDLDEDDVERAAAVFSEIMGMSRERNRLAEEIRSKSQEIARLMGDGKKF